MPTFRRLLRHFISGLADNDLITAGEDLHAPIAGALAGCIVVSGAVALTFLAKYNAILTQIDGRVVAQRLALEDKLAMAVDDKALLLGIAMIVIGLVAVAFWDRFVLDARDQAILGALPVRPAAVLAAKTAAVGVGAAVLALALNAPPALLFPIVVLMNTPATIADVGRASAAHALAGLAGCAFMFLTLSVCRGLIEIMPSRGVLRRLLPLAQFVLILALLALLLSWPVVAGRTRAALDAGSRMVYFSPPLWFLGVEERLIGRGGPIVDELARTGLIALAASLFVAGAVLAGSWFLRFHRTATAAASPDSGSGRLLSMALERLARVCWNDGRIRASFMFTARTITRSPRHRLSFAGALGVGLAVSGVTIASAHAGLGLGQPFDLKSMALAGQLNLIFFVVVGLRMASTVPADLAAGWVFRFTAAPAVERHIAGTRAAIFIVAILPLLLLLAPVHAWLWGGYAAVVHFAFGVVAALGLLEIVFTGYARMPFVSSFTPGRTALTPRLGLYVFDYLLFAYVTPSIELALIERPALFYVWIGLLMFVVRRSLGSHGRWRRDHLPVFEDQAEAVEQLGLRDVVHSRADRPSAGRPTTPRPRSAPSPQLGPPAMLDGGRRRSWIFIGQETWRAGMLAGRRLRADLRFTAFSVATLSIAICATTAVYSVLYSSILRPLDVPDLPSLVNIYHSNPRAGSRSFHTMSLADFVDLERLQTSFAAVAAHAPFRQVVIVDGTGESIQGEMVSDRYFEVLGIQPALGRLLHSSDNRPGSPPVAVIDDRTWRRRFGGRRDIAGQVMRMGSTAVEIVGVAPAGFRGVELPNLAPTAVWLPLQTAKLVGVVPPAATREDRWLLGHGRLAPDRTLDAAVTELRLIGSQLDSAHPIGGHLLRSLQSPPLVSRRWEAIPAAERRVTERADATIIHLARLSMLAVVLVLLVACTNLSNLTMARGLSRRRHLAVQLALGASRRRLACEQILESAFLVGLGVVGALLLVGGLVRAGVNTAIRFAPGITVTIAPRIDLPTIVVGVALAGLALLIFGVVPVWRLTSQRISLSDAANEWGAAAGPRSHGRHALIVSQVAVSVALVAISGLCARHVITAAARQTGIDLDRIATVRFDFAVQGWGEDRARPTVERIAEEARRLPGIAEVAIVSGLPIRGFGRSASLTIPEQPFDQSGNRGVQVLWLSITPSAFDAVGLSIKAGRALRAQDVSAVVLSETAARRLFNDVDVVGRTVLRRVESGDGGFISGDPLTVIGVAGDSSPTGARTAAAAYVPFAGFYEPSLTIVARTEGSTAAAAGALQRLAHRLEPQLGIIEAAAGRDLRGPENMVFEVMGALAGFLGTVATALALTGLYGVLSYDVAQRTREMSIRVALGASRGRIMRLVLMVGIRPVVEGLVVGFLLADLGAMAIEPLLQQPLPAMDGPFLAAMPLLFLLAALLASCLPARRAWCVDPSTVLRGT
jgi:predicted permease